MSPFLIWLSGFLAGAGVAFCAFRFIPQRLDLHIVSKLHLHRHRAESDDSADFWKHED